MVCGMVVANGCWCGVGVHCGGVLGKGKGNALLV